MAHLEITNLQHGYHTLLEWVLECGEETSPRGLKTKEIVNASVVLTDPTQALPIRCGRNIAENIAAAEALQLIGGFSNPALLPPSFDAFKDGGVFHGAYGPRTRMQMTTAIRRLSDDHDTRQAVVTVWDPLHDMQPGLKDYPCTVALQFLIRKGKLQLHTHMRSNDAWRGVAYDFFQFTQLQLAVAAVLDIDVGYYFHHATSLHLYETDWQSAEACRVAKIQESFIHKGLVDREACRLRTSPEDTWRELQESLKHAITSSTPLLDHKRGGAAWYMVGLP